MEYVLSLHQVIWHNLSPFLYFQGHATLTYRRGGEKQRTVHETYEEGRPNSHDKNSCLICKARRSRESETPMHTSEDYPSPRHSDYEGDFAEAGLGRSSPGDDEEDTYETTCGGIQDIIFTGEVYRLLTGVLPTADIGCAQTDPNHGMAWGRFTFLGRVRPWDGLIALVRLPVRVHSPLIALQAHNNPPSHSTLTTG
jgi:hypothetical protein